MIIDFKEIPEAHLSTGQQDSFELFARDFFENVMKLKIISQPNRGADGGKDILAEEILVGNISDEKTIWLISCKHKAHSGKAVNDEDEQNIMDRIQQHHANGFIGFYSTLASSGLGARFDSFRGKCKVECFDHERIENYMIKHKQFELFKRYFPASFAQWNTTRIETSNMLDDYGPLRCCVCGKDLLSEENKFQGNIVFCQRKNDNGAYTYEEIVVTCIGKCDDYISRKAFAKYDCATGWKGLYDIIIPAHYFKHLIATMNTIFSSSDNYSETAFGQYKNIMITLSQFVFRTQSKEELDRVRSLLMLPEGL